MMINRRAAALSAAFVLFASLSTVVWADGKNTETRLRTTLSGGVLNGKTPSGSADFRSESAKNRTRLNVEVEHVALADGTLLDVSVTHAGVATTVGSIKLSLGEGELELNSEDGATVPAIVKGDMVTVSSAGAPILSGVF